MSIKATQRVLGALCLSWVVSSRYPCCKPGMCSRLVNVGFEVQHVGCT